jgi:putative heme-binding domain-containing protein
MTPGVRDAALDQMMRSDSGMETLLQAVSDEIVQPSAIGWGRTVRLMRDTEGALRDQARALLSEPPGVREQVVESYFASLDLDGDIEAGGRVFEQTCGVCHQVAGQHGVAFGPDLGTVRHWSARALLAKILMPQRTIADGYGLWSVEKKDGTTEAGIIETESPASLTLRRQGQEPITILRKDLLRLENLNASAMPAGFEKQLNAQQMADLIAFLRFN